MALALVLAALLFAGCQTAGRPADALLPGQGQLAVYLAEMPQGTERFFFTLQEISAVRADGTSIPLDLYLTEISGGGVRRQRLLAAGRVPEGTYVALSFIIGKSWVQREDGDAALLPPPAPVTVDVPFTVRDRGAVLLETAYRHTGSIVDDSAFCPLLSACAPSAPLLERSAWVTGAWGCCVTVFDRKTLQVTGLVAVGLRPTGLALDERNRRAYVAVAGEDSVAVLDMYNGAILGRIPLQGGDSPEALALSPDGRRLLSANPGSDTVSVMDPESLLEMTRIQVGQRPRWIMYDRTGKTAYVFNRLSDSISVIDPAQGAVVGTIATETGPVRAALNRAGNRLYVIHEHSPYLVSYNTTSLAQAGRVYVGMGATCILVNSLTDLVYVARRGVSRVDVFDPLALLPVDALKTPGGGAVDMVIDNQENRLLLALPGVRLVTAMDFIGKTARGTFDVGPEPHSLGCTKARP